MVELAGYARATRTENFHDAAGVRVLRHANAWQGATARGLSSGLQRRGDTQPLTAPRRCLPFIFLILNCYFLQRFFQRRRRAVVWTGSLIAQREH